MSRELGRPVAIAVIMRGAELLVYAVPHPKGGVGWLPPRGIIELGHQGSDVAVRAVREQLGVEVVDPSLLGILEHDYPYPGVEAHEHAEAYSVRFSDPGLYEREQFDCVEAEGVRSTCIWMKLADFNSRVARLYPHGVTVFVYLRGVPPDPRSADPRGAA